MRRARRLLAAGPVPPTDQGRPQEHAEFTELELEELRATRWSRLGEVQRTQLEWLHGNPYYMPSFGGVCESFGEYEQRLHHLRLSMEDSASVRSDSDTDLERALNLQKSTVQRTLFDEVHSESNWLNVVKGRDWMHQLQSHQQDASAKFEGLTTASEAHVNFEEKDPESLRRQAEHDMSPHPLPRG